MARVCELTGKRVMSGNNVSHAHNKTKRRFLPNLHKATLLSESLGETFSFRIAASTLRSIEHNEGLDNFLAKAKAEELSPKARKIKKRIATKRAEAPTS